MSKKVRLVDVAEESGVSVAAASFALSGNGRVSEETRKRVEEVAARLGYRANATAQNLRRRRHGVLGIYLPHEVTTHEYYMEFVFGVIEAADEAGLSVLLLSHSVAPQVGLDAVIVLDVADDDEQAADLLRGSAPVIAAERIPSSWPAPAATVLVDHESLTYTLLESLATEASRKIALLVPGDESEWSRGLRTGYRTWCADRGRTPLEARSPFAVAGPELAEPLSELFARDRPDAIVAGPDSSADPVRAWLLAHGYEDVEVAAYVLPTFVGTDATITGIDLGARGFGRRCAQVAGGVVAGDVARGHEEEFTVPGLRTAARLV